MIRWTRINRLNKWLGEQKRTFPWGTSPPPWWPWPPEPGYYVSYPLVDPGGVETVDVVPAGAVYSVCWVASVVSHSYVDPPAGPVEGNVPEYELAYAPDREEAAAPWAAEDVGADP